ncbi:MAG: preprotein translocase subunit SecE [Bacilli bacterium]
MKDYFSGVITELKRVRWPLKKEVLKYSVATVSLIIFYMILFTCVAYLINMVVA